MKIFVFLCLFGVMGFNSAFPKSGYHYPRAYMIGSSYYANPRYVRQGPGYEYIPPGQMTAMVLGDTVATNTFSGPGFNPPPPPAGLSVLNTDVGQINEEQVSEHVTDKQLPLLVSYPESDSINETEPQEEHQEPEQPSKNFAGEQETLFSVPEATTEGVIPTTKAIPVVPIRVPSAGKKVKTGRATRPTTAAPQPTEEEDDEDDAGLPGSWPFGGAGRAGIPNYNAFFPIFIGGSSPSSRSRTRSAEHQEGGYPGSATAIANSFSTGKGGVATSHATSFGDPYAAAMFRNAGLFNFKTKSSKKQVILGEDD